MTIIVALRSDDAVWVGSDGRISDFGETATDDFQKWRRTAKGIWWASAGHIRVYTMMETNREKLSEFLTCLELCEGFRKMVTDDGWIPCQGENRGGPVDYGFYLIVTDGREILHYHGDGSMVRHEVTGDFCAYGSGKPYAMGAISLARRYVDYQMSNDEDCEEIVEGALQAACDYDQGCGGTFFIEKVVA